MRRKHKYLRALFIGFLITGILFNGHFSALGTTGCENYFHYGFNGYYMYGVKTGQTLLDLKNSLLQQSEVNSVYFYDENFSTLSTADEENIAYTGMHAYINSKLVKIIVYGDVNGDGAVTVSDKVALRSYVVSGLSSSSPYFKAGDMDCSESLSSSDVNDLNDYILYGLGSIYGFSASDNFSSAITQFQSFASNMNYSGFIHNISSDEATTLSAIQNSTIFVTRTHGNQHQAFLTDSNDGPTLNYYDIDALSSNALSKNRLVYYGSCSAGKGGESASNLVNSTYNKGAEIVIGFQEDVLHYPTDVWSEQFFKSVSNGVSVAQALSEADYVTELQYSTFVDKNKNRLSRGDLTQIPAHPANANYTQLGYSDNITTMSANATILAADIINSSVEKHKQIMPKDISTILSLSNPQQRT